MQRLVLKKISLQTRMTVLLPLILLSVMLVAVAVVSHLRKNTPADTGDVREHTTAKAALPSAAPSDILLIVHEKTPVYLTVMRLDPATATVWVTPLAANAQLDGGTVKGLYAQSGAAALCTAFSEKLAVPLEHYVDFSVDGLQQLLQYYGNGLTVTLKEPLSYTDEAGLFASFPAGKIWLSANQAAELLRVNVERDNADFAAAVFSAMIDRYIVPQRRFDKDYAALTAAAVTDIRIYDFEHRQALLCALAEYAPLSVQLAAIPADFDAQALKDWKKALGG